MAIYIKGVEMPKGDDCTILTVYSDGVVYLRQYKDRMCLEDSTNATYIPEPHGRLIDVDELSKKLCETTIFIKDGEVFQRMINDAPTVIEGSE